MQNRAGIVLVTGGELRAMLILGQRWTGHDVGAVWLGFDLAKLDPQSCPGSESNTDGMIPARQMRTRRLGRELGEIGRRSVGSEALPWVLQCVPV